MQEALLMGGELFSTADLDILIINQDNVAANIFSCWHRGFSSKIERPKIYNNFITITMMKITQTDALANIRI